MSQKIKTSSRVKVGINKGIHIEFGKKIDDFIDDHDDIPLVYLAMHLCLYHI